MTLSRPSLIMTLFVRALGGSNFLAGLVPSIEFVGWLTPQFLAAGRMRRLSRFLPLVQALEILRTACYLIIAGVAFAYGREHPILVLGVFFALLVILRIAAGTSIVARTEIIARMVPAKERVTVISLRSFTGGIAGLLSGFAVRYVLDERTSQFPDNYAILIGLSGVCFGLAIAVLSLVKEPVLPFNPEGINLLHQLKRVPLILKSDRPYLLYIGVRAAATGLELAAPFYVIYATEVLSAPAAMVGTYIAMRTFSRVLSNLFWGNQCKKRGSLWVLRAGRTLAILAALGAALVPPVTSRIWGASVPTWVASAFGLVFFFHGLSMSADMISRLSYLYEIAPVQDRPTYYGLANTIVGPLYLLPALGGALVDTVGFAPIFAAAAASMVIAYVLASKLAIGDSARKN